MTETIAMPEDEEPTKTFTRLDAVGVPYGSPLGKASVTNVVQVDNSAAALKRRLTGTPSLAPKKLMGVPTMAPKYTSKKDCAQCQNPDLKGLHTCKNGDKPFGKAVGLRAVPKKLKTLDAWNNERREICSSDPIKNGIACPKCGAELYDTLPGNSWSNFNGTFVDIACAAD